MTYILNYTFLVLKLSPFNYRSYQKKRKKGNWRATEDANYDLESNVSRNGLSLFHLRLRDSVARP